MTAFNRVFMVEIVGDTLIVTPNGSASGFRYADIHEESNIVHRRLGDPTIRHLIVDLGNLDSISSVMIGAMVRLLRRTSNTGGQALMCQSSADLSDVLDTMNLCKLWPCFATREDALLAIQSQDSTRADDGDNPDATVFS